MSGSASSGLRPNCGIDAMGHLQTYASQRTSASARAIAPLQPCVICPGADAAGGPVKPMFWRGIPISFFRPGANPQVFDVQKGGIVSISLAMAALFYFD
jgi:hypothetical protein